MYVNKLQTGYIYIIILILSYLFGLPQLQRFVINFDIAAGVCCLFSAVFAISYGGSPWPTDSFPLVCQKEIHINKGVGQAVIFVIIFLSFVTNLGTVVKIRSLCKEKNNTHIQYLPRGIAIPKSDRATVRILVFMSLSYFILHVPYMCLVILIRRLLLHVKYAYYGIIVVFRIIKVIYDIAGPVIHIFTVMYTHRDLKSKVRKYIKCGKNTIDAKYEIIFHATLEQYQINLSQSYNIT